MKKLRLPRHFKLNHVLTWTGLFFVVTFALIEHMSISIGAVSQIKMPLLYAGLICVITQLKPLSRVVLRKNYLYTLLTLLLLCVLLGVSALSNRNAVLGDSPLTKTIRLILYLIELFLLMILQAERGKGQATIKFLLWYLLGIVAVNDFLLFSRAVTFRTGGFESYFVGTKFTVAYLHMDLLTLWAMSSKRSIRSYKFAKWKILLAAVFIIALSIRIDIMTGIIGCIALVALFVLAESPRGSKLFRLTSPWVLLIGLIVSVILAFTADSIMQIPVVKYVVENLLKRDSTITGRLNIYQEYFANMEDHWLLGYGYGNANVVSVTMFGYENVQNGILQWILQIGIFATTALVLLLFRVFRQIPRRRSANIRKIMPAVALIYMFIILGTIETTIDMAFILWFAVIFMLSNERIPAPPKVVEAKAL